MSDLSYRPRAREQGLFVEPLGEELLVFDSERNRAHSLNETAARVWRACDGERDIYALQVHCALDEETLHLALERLRTSRLLDEPEEPSRVSRRAMLRRSAVAGAGIGVALPVIRSIVAPTPAMAASAVHCPGGTGCGALSLCTSQSVCASGCAEGVGSTCNAATPCCYASGGGQRLSCSAGGKCVVK